MQGQLVVDDERRSILVCELGGGHPAEYERAVLDRRTVGKKLGKWRFDSWLHRESIVTLMNVNLLLT